jgi:hypothetical protein
MKADTSWMNTLKGMFLFGKRVYIPWSVSGMGAIGLVCVTDKVNEQSGTASKNQH